MRVSAPPDHLRPVDDGARLCRQGIIRLVRDRGVHRAGLVSEQLVGPVALREDGEPGVPKHSVHDHLVV